MKREAYEIQTAWDARKSTRGIWPVLRGRNAVWHRTDISGLRGILRRGVILPNSENEFPSKHPGQSAHSVGRKLGAVSTFDFDTLDRQSVFRSASHWQRFLLHFDPTIFIRLNPAIRSRAEFIGVDAVLPDEVMRGLKEGEVPFIRVHIPYVEAYHIGPVPADLIDGILLIDTHSGYNWRFIELDLTSELMIQIEAIGAGWREEAEARATAEFQERIELAVTRFERHRKNSAATFARIRRQQAEVKK